MRIFVAILTFESITEWYTKKCDSSQVVMVLLRAPLNVYFNLTNYPYFRYDSLHDLDFNLFPFTKIKLITLESVFRYAKQLEG